MSNCTVLAHRNGSHQFDCLIDGIHLFNLITCDNYIDILKTKCIATNAPMTTFHFINYDPSDISKFLANYCCNSICDFLN